MSGIRAAGLAELPAFFAYLNAHLAENGAAGAPLFQPLARAASVFGPERQQAFRSALATPLDAPGWRRLWLATGEDGEILGHIDLRARPEACPHRVLLGMGVHSAARRQGLGLRLLDVARDWALAQGKDWIDLEVLADNSPARTLYARYGFQQTGCIPDMFRIDGAALAYCSMSLALRP